MWYPCRTYLVLQAVSALTAGASAASLGGELGRSGRPSSPDLRSALDIALAAAAAGSHVGQTQRRTARSAPASRTGMEAPSVAPLVGTTAVREYSVSLGDPWLPLLSEQQPCQPQHTRHVVYVAGCAAFNITYDSCGGGCPSWYLPWLQKKADSDTLYQRPYVFINACLPTGVAQRVTSLPCVDSAGPDAPSDVLTVTYSTVTGCRCNTVIPQTLPRSARFFFRVPKITVRNP